MLHIAVETFFIPKRCFRVHSSVLMCIITSVTLCLFCQTRDDFLGQVDVPLNQIPVSFFFFFHLFAL